MSDSPETRLDSWKEIAAYLNRHVTTVRRWEKAERLPVHRHVHDKLGSVYAFRAEFDAWWQTRRLQIEHDHEETTSARELVDDRAAGCLEQTARPAPAASLLDRGKATMSAGVFAVCLLAAAAGSMIHGGSAISARPPIASLAVLPLENLSGDPGQEYFADGITEALIGQLAQIRALRVVSRVSVMSFKGTSGLYPLNQ